MTFFFRSLINAFLLFTVFIYSQNFQKVKISNITSNRTASISQDSLGFLWFGTDEGLNKYDGIENRQYKSNIFDEKTLSSNRIRDIYIDKNNSVWVLNDRGLDLYEELKDNFIRFPTKTKPVHLFNKKDFIYITTSQSGLFVLNKKDRQMRIYSFDPLDPLSISSSRFSSKQTNPIAISDETMWLGTTNGLNKISLKTQASKRFYSEKAEFVENDTINAVQNVKEGLLIGTSKGVVLYNDKTNKSKKISNRQTNNIEKIGQGDYILFIGNKTTMVLNKEFEKIYEIKQKEPKTKLTQLTEDQYLIWSPGMKETLLLNTNKNNELGIEISSGFLKNTPQDILVDNQSNVWVASNKGVYVAANINKPAKFIKSQKITKANAFTRTQHNHIIFSNNAIYEASSKEIKKIKDIKVQKKIKKKNVHMSLDGQVFIYDENISILTNKQTLNKIFRGETPINFLTTDNRILIGSFQNSGVFSIDRKTQQKNDYRENRLIAKNLPVGASAILIVGNTAWLGSDESGLYEVDMSLPEKPQLIEHHIYKKNDPTSFTSSSVSCIVKTGKEIAIGTNGDGLFVFTENRQFNRFSSEEGLLSNNIISIGSSSDSILWVLTNGGVSIINKKTEEINNLGKDEGLTSFVENQNSLVVTKSGNALVMDKQGYYTIKREDIHIDDFQQKVIINNIELYDRNNTGKKVTTRPVLVNHKTPTINISFSAPTFYKPQETTYSYKTVGYNNTWVDNGTARNIRLQGLDPGRYTTLIKSYNSGGYESQNTAEITFQIIPPWWKTWWAYLSYIIILSSGVFYYVRYQTKAQQKAAEDKRKEEELEEARQFQLDMLPRETPNYLDLDISAAIQTASEVGGDYYDYFPQEDKKSLYVVVGDATGHGMTAGMMVSITKAGLYGIPSIPPNEIATRLNRVIKAIDLGLNRMAFNMARFWEDKVEFTSAAMPPAYHYRAKTKDVDEILLGGLPLGSIKDETFSLEEFSFEKGDSLIFISDGLPEATNKENEMLGYEAVFECVKSNGERNAESQKQALLDLGTSWLGDLQNQDDITIVVVKKTISLD